ncbi:MAG: tyrosine-type recombinase/integrase [Victivallales bacterium]|nr:tyrosine-type recombinase/integrase [Victivallales bacterium]
MAFIRKQHGSKFFYVCWTEKVDGKTVWKKKSTGEMDREKAQEYLELFNEVRSGRARRDRLTEFIREAGMGTISQEVELSDLWDWYTSHCEVSGAAKQQRDRHNALDRFIAWLRDKHPEYTRVQEISLRLASEYWQSLADKGDAPSTRNNNLSALNTIWSFIQAPMELPTNPWAAIKRDRNGSIPYQPFTHDELEALRKAAREYTSQNAEPGFWPAAIEMGYYTGLRLGDIATLTSNELRTEDDFLVLIPNKTRHWGDDRVAVHSLSLPWVRMLPPILEESDAFIWPKAATSYQATKLSEEFTAIAKAAGIQLDREPEDGERRNKAVRLKTFHSLRHTFATDALKAGMTESDLRDQGNWSGTEVIHDHYNHAKMELAKKAARKVAVLFKKSNKENKP